MWKLLRRIRYWIKYREHEDALAEELEFHRAMKQEDLERAGMPPADAAVESRRALGNTLAAIESTRTVWIWSWVDEFVRDTRFGARSLLKSPGFTIFATLVLSIGIGAAVTVFAHFNSVFFKDLNIPNAESFVRIYGTESVNAPIGKISYSSYLQYQDRNLSLTHIGMSATSRTRFPLRLSGPHTLPVDVVQPTIVSHGVFKAIAAGMVLGREIEPEDEKTGAPNLVVLNEEAWNRYFGRDVDILNKNLYLNNTPYRIVGVASQSLQDAFSLFPTRPSPQLFIPVREDSPPQGLVDVAGRLAPGVSQTEAQADFSRIAAQLSVEKEVTVSASVERADLPPSWLLRQLAAMAALFLVIVLAVLLIACDDIAIMLLARIAARQREMGIRVALGGSRLRLIRQLVSENVLISILGGVGAVIFMLLASRLIERLPIPLPDTSRAVFDWRVLVFTILTSLATTLFFGLRPALECVNRDVLASLSPGAKTGSRRPARVRSNLVVGQIAFCTALLITAADVTLAVLHGNVFVDRGFKTDHLLLADINFVGALYNRDSQFGFYRQLLPRLNATPGIESASIVNTLESFDMVQIGAGNLSLRIETTAIDEGYFGTLQVPLVAGRDLNEQDDLNSAPVGIINQKMASLFPRVESPIGQRIRTRDGTAVEIVGVARDIDYGAGARFVRPVLYRPLKQIQTTPSDTVTIMLKFSGTVGAARRIIHDKVAELDPSLLVYNMMTLDDQLERRLLPDRLLGYAIGMPGVFALLLGIVGSYGTMAILVAQRRREVGIRIALGAHPSTAVRGILNEGIRSICVGVGFGVAAVVIILLWLSRNIGEVRFFDPIAFVAMILLVIITAGAACYIPAKRASRFDPMVVLRED